MQRSEARPPASAPVGLASTWDLVAEDYAVEVAPTLVAYATRALALARATRGARPLARVVDVATGPGTLAFLAAEQGLHVDAVDFSPRMVTALATELARRGLLGVTPCVGDGMALPYADAVFDAGFSMFGLMFFPDRGAGLRELARVLRPQAPVVLSSWAPLAHNPLLHATVQALWELTLTREEIAARSTFVPPLSSRESCLRELTEAGFLQVEVHPMTARVSYPSTRAMIASFVRSSAPFALAKQALGDGFAAIEEQLVTNVSSQFGAGAQQVDMPAILTVGVKS
jgi:ubiquinone/menaquinone biosynthesis C-methylase UbiE